MTALSAAAGLVMVTSAVVSGQYGIGGAALHALADAGPLGFLLVGAVLSQPLSYLFIMAPRTACTATGVHLCKQYEGWWLPERDIHDANGNILVQRKHSTVRQLVRHALITPRQVEELFVFTAVRNPFDSLVSLWVKKTTSYQPLLDDPDSFVNRVPGFADDMRWMLDHTFSEWVQRQYGHLRDGRPRHLYGGYMADADFIMRFETLQEDFVQAMERVGVDDVVDIPVLNVTEERTPDYRDYYTDRARRLVERVFEADLKRFGYDF